MGDGTDNSYNNNAAIGNNLGTNGTFDNKSTIEGTGGIVLTAGRHQRWDDYRQCANRHQRPDAPHRPRRKHPESTGRFEPPTRVSSTSAVAPVVETRFTQRRHHDCGRQQHGRPTERQPVCATSANGTLTGGTYNVTGTLQIPGNITTNDAKITLTGKTSQILNPSTNALTGFVTNGAKGSFDLKAGQTFTSAGTFTNQGAITIGKGSTFTVGSGGSYLQTERQNYGERQAHPLDC